MKYLIWLTPRAPFALHIQQGWVDKKEGRNTQKENVGEYKFPYYNAIMLKYSFSLGMDKDETNKQTNKNQLPSVYCYVIFSGPLITYVYMHGIYHFTLFESNQVLGYFAQVLLFYLYYPH